MRNSADSSSHKLTSVPAPCRPSGVNAASAPPPAGAASLQLLQPQQAPSSYEVPPVPAALRDSLYILDAKKGQHMLHHLDQVRAIGGDRGRAAEGGLLLAGSARMAQQLPTPMHCPLSYCRSCAAPVTACR